MDKSQQKSVLFELEECMEEACIKLPEVIEVSI